MLTNRELARALYRAFEKYNQDCRSCMGGDISEFEGGNDIIIDGRFDFFEIAALLRAGVIEKDG